MIETVHVITAISRPENVARVAESLSVAAMYCEETKFVWHWRFDIKRTGIAYAHQIKNEMIDDIHEGWVWILDDDTSVHPDLFLEFEKQRSSVEAFVVCQKRADGRILIASRKNSRVDFIDSNQAIIKRSAIGHHRMTSDYAGDGHFLEAVLQDCDAFYSDKILCFHNIL